MNDIDLNTAYLILLEENKKLREEILSLILRSNQQIEEISLLKEELEKKR